jgi:RNA-directed DNA polymerase
MTTSNASPTPPGEDAPAGGTHRALRQDEAIPQELLQAVLASDNLARAWQRVKSNKGAPGIDGVTVQDWPAHARDHWPALREQLEGGRYEPQPVRRVEIPKPGGGKRMLGIPKLCSYCTSMQAALGF